MDFGGALWLSCNKRQPASQNLRPVCKRIAPISDPSDTTAAREQGGEFMPRFDSAGLLTAIAQDAASGEVLMVAFMDREALEATRRTGLAHFHSRSRGRLWMKGETSGHTLHVEAILVDCDQDALVLKVRPAGPACHTGERSCFYRALEGDGLTRFEG
jgi:phosphoribosyl-AMP cyclohydrolase